MASPSEHDTSEEESSDMPNWILETKFPDEKSAIEHLMAEEIWSIDRKQCYQVQGGREVHYRCNRANSMGSNCHILKRLYIPRDRDEVLLYKQFVQHSHDKNSTKRLVRHRMELNIKLRIQKLMENIKEPKEIMLKLLAEGFEVNQSISQIRSYCQKVRRKKKPQKWKFEKSFDQIGKAKLYLKRQKIWNVKFQLNTYVGMTYHYRCNLVPRTGPQCAAGKHFTVHKNTKEVTLFQKNCQHTHMDILNMSHLDLKTKTDWLLQQLDKRIRDPLLEQGFRVLDAVVLQDCLAEPDDFHKSVMLQQKPCTNIDYEIKKEVFINDEDSTGIPVPVRENLYENNDENNETLNISKKTPQKPVFTSDWLFEKKFANEQLALDYLAKDEIWRIDPRRTYTVTGGRKAHYRCNRVKVYGPQCDALKCLFYSVGSEEVILYKKDSDHTHNSIPVQFRTTKKPCTNIDYQIKKEVFINDEGPTGFPVPVRENLYENNDENNETLNISKRKHQKPLFTSDWLFEKKFANEQLALDYLAKDEIWRIDLRKTYTVTGGRKAHYRCNRVKVYGPQCAAWKCLFYSVGSEEVALYKKDSDHTHNSIPAEFRTTKKIIKRLKQTEKRKLANTHISDDADGAVPVIKRKPGQPDCSCNSHDSQESHATTMEPFTGDVSCDVHSPELITYDDKNDNLQVSNDNDFSMKTTKTGKIIEWSLDDKIPTKDMVSSYLNKQNTWRCTNQRGMSPKVYYCCSTQNCKAEMCIFYQMEPKEVLVYRKGEHIHEIVYGTENLPLHFNATQIIPDTYPNSNIIVKEELIIIDEPVATNALSDGHDEQMVTAQKWTFENKFANMDKANEFLDTSNGLWKIKSTTKQKSFYRCTHPCEPPCTAHIFFLIENGSNEVLYFSGDPHVHPIQNEKISNEVVIIDSDKEAPKSESTTVPTMNFKINMNVSETTENTIFLQATKSTECIEEIIISDDSGKDTLNGDDVKITLGEWTFETKFDDYKTAKHYMKNLNLLSFKSVLSKYGVKEYYNCNLAVSGVEHCPLSKYLLYDDKDNDVLLYNRNIQHVTVCTNIIPPLVPVQKRTTNIIDLRNGDDDNKASKDSNRTMVNLDKDEITPQQNTTLNGEIKWILEREFNTALEATEYLKSEQIWYFQVKNQSNVDLKEFYRCNLARSTGPQCAAAKYIHIKYKDATNVISLYRTEQNHTHAIKTSTAQAYQIYDTLDETTKEMIKKLVKTDHSPKQIIAKLAFLHFDVQSEKHLYNWISKMRRSLRMRAITEPESIGFIKTLEAWLSQHTIIPDNEDEYFCVGFNIDSKYKFFRCFLSTRRLLKNAVDSNLIHLDSTGSFHWQKNPVTIVGTTDLAQNFHLFGIAISSDKYDLDYEFIFRSIREGVFKCHKKVFRPECLITDDNEDVQRAFIKRFGNSSKIGICSQAALTKIFLKLSASSDSDLMKNLVRQDILNLQKLSSQNLFSKAVVLFFQKWRARAGVQLGEFLNYFKTDWIDRNSNWFQGFRPFTPNTNIALLDTSEKLMKNYTFKQNLPIQSFRYHIQIELEQMSLSYLLGNNTNYKQIVQKPIIPMSVYEKAIAWNKLEKQIEIAHRGSEIFYYISAGDGRFINEEKLHKYRTCEHETLDDFFDIQFSFYCVRRLLSNETLTCSCSNFMENYVCEHSVGMASVLNLIQFPPEMDLRQLNKGRNNAIIVNYINKA